MNQIAPLTSRQNELWHAANPHGSVWAIFSGRVMGEHNAQAWLDAWRAVCQRETIARLAFGTASNGSPHQFADPHAKLVGEVHMSASADESAWNAWVTETRDTLAASVPRLDAAPLMRIELLTDADGRARRYVWIWPRMLLDFWSARLFLDAIRAELMGEDRSKVVAADFLKVGEWLAAHDFAEERTLFGEDLAGAAPLPPRRTLDAPRKREIIVDAETTGKLKALATSWRCTYVAVMQTVFSMLMAHWYGVSDVVYGVLTSGRTGLTIPGMNQAIGPFGGAIPLRTNVSPDTELAAVSHSTLARTMTRQQHDYVALWDVHRWFFSELPHYARWCTGIFEVAPARPNTLPAVGFSVDDLLVVSQRTIHLPFLYVLPLPTGGLRLNFVPSNDEAHQVELERGLGAFELLLQNVASGQSRTVADALETL